jgi:hypothetical protein
MMMDTILKMRIPIPIILWLYEMTPSDQDEASTTMLPILRSLPMAAEELDMEAYPILGQLIPSESGGLLAWHHSGPLCDIVNLYKKSKTLHETAMSFPYGNGKDWNLAVVPKTNSYANFSKLNREKQWIAQIMKHMSSEKSDRVNGNSDNTDKETLPIVKWLCRHLATKCETNYLLAAKQAEMLILLNASQAYILRTRELGNFRLASVMTSKKE